MKSILLFNFQMTSAALRSSLEDGEDHAPWFEPCDTPCHAVDDCGLLPAVELGICGCETCAGGLSSAAAPDRSFPARRRIDAHGRGRGRRAVASFPSRYPGACRPWRCQ